MIIQSLNDSIETSITLCIFKSYKIALLYHIFNGILQYLLLQNAMNYLISITVVFQQILIQ